MNKQPFYTWVYDPCFSNLVPTEYDIHRLPHGRLEGPHPNFISTGTTSGITGCKAAKLFMMHDTNRSKPFKYT